MIPHVCKPSVLTHAASKTSIRAAFLTKQVRQARDRGFRVEVHAIGDRALASVLDACEEAGLTAEDRPIVTHCQVKIARSGVNVLFGPKRN